MPIPNIPPGFTVSDIKAELGSNSNSLLALGQEAGFGVPFFMSDFAGYSAATNVRYYNNDGVNDYAQILSGARNVSLGVGSYSISFWVRQNSSVNKNAQLLNISPTFDKNNRLMIDYNTSNNKLRFNHRADGSNTMREFYLANNSGAGTGGPWTSGTRGNTNDEGWTMLTFVYDGNMEGLDGLQVYWNTNQLNHQAEVMGSRSPLDITNMRIGENIHITASAGCANMDFDEIKIYNKLLTPSEITQLYANGTIMSASAAGVTSNLISEISFESDANTVDTAGHFSEVLQVYNGGNFRNH